eukprot:364235-Chlamydomonas_euryale.AAC.8
MSKDCNKCSARPKAAAWKRKSPRATSSLLAGHQMLLQFYSNVSRYCGSTLRCSQSDSKRNPTCRSSPYRPPPRRPAAPPMHFFQSACPHRPPFPLNPQLPGRVPFKALACNAPCPYGVPDPALLLSSETPLAPPPDVLAHNPPTQPPLPPLRRRAPFQCACPSAARA